MTQAMNSFTISRETTEFQAAPLSTFITHHHWAMLIVMVSVTTASLCNHGRLLLLLRVKKVGLLNCADGGSCTALYYLGLLLQNECLFE
jgi:hypothetical protein